MKIEAIRAEALTEDMRRRWLQIQQSVPEFDNPFLHPDFTAAVARVRDDVEIGILEDAGTIVGFFPFQRSSRYCGKPVGGRLSDFQAVITQPDCTIAADELLRGCRLKAWDFDHLIGNRGPFARYTHFRDGSPYIDLSQGFEAYQQERSQPGKTELQQASRKSRKLARELGPLKLEATCLEPDMFEQLVRWKSAQYERTNVTNVFRFGWTIELLRELLRASDGSLQGVLNVLYAGERPVAWHYGMLAHGVLHYWFPTYDNTLAGYSPGRVLLLELCRFCRELGIRRIDLGRGMAPYKTRVMTGVTEVAIGSVDLRPVTSVMRSSWRQTQDWIRQSPLRRHLRGPGRAMYRFREWLAFR